MKKINTLLTVLILAFTNNVYANENLNEIENLTLAIKKNCNKFSTEVYLDLDKKNTCLILLKKGVILDIYESKKILGLSLLNGINMPKNESVGKKYLEIKN